MSAATAAGIPSVAWRRPLGQPVEGLGRPRVSHPMLDDREWAGVPIGGMGAGSIGLTHRGDFARWHLRVGRHRFLPVAADGFALSVGTPEGRWASPLAAGIGAHPPGLRSGPAGGRRARTARSSRAPGSVYDRPPVPVRAHVRAAHADPARRRGHERPADRPVPLDDREHRGPTRATVGLMFTFRDPRGEESGRGARGGRLVRARPHVRERRASSSTALPALRPSSAGRSPSPSRRAGVISEPLAVRPGSTPRRRPTRGPSSADGRLTNLDDRRTDGRRPGPVAAAALGDRRARRRASPGP